MIYAGDLYVSLPTRDLYDTQMMMAAVNAAKDRYEKAYKEQKDFIDEYKQFVSPSIADTQYVRDNTIGTVINEIDDLYNRGIDPLRSGEGIGRLYYLMNKLKTGPIQERIESLKNMHQYQQNVAKAKLDGTYNTDLEKIRLGGKTPENWDTSENGIWTEQAPAKYEDPSSIIAKIYKNFNQSEYLGPDPNNSDFYLSGMSKDSKDKAEAAGMNALKQSESYPLYKKTILDNLIANANAYDPKTGYVSFIDQKGNVTLKNVNDDELIDEGLLNIVRTNAAQYTQPKSIEKSDSFGNLRKASASRSSGSRVTIVNGGSLDNYSDNPNYRPDFNIASLQQIAFANPADENIGYSIDVAFAKAKTNASKIKGNDKKSEAILTDPSICFSYYDIPTISEVIANERSMSFNITPGMVHNMVTADEVVPQSRNGNGKTKRDIIEKSFSFYYAEGGFYRQTASPTGRISYVPTKNDEIRPYYELIITVPDYDNLKNIPDAVDKSITQPRAQSTKTFTMWYPSGEYYSKEQTENGGFIRLDKGQRSGQEQKYTGTAYGYSSPTPKANPGVGHSAQTEVELMRLEESEQQKKKKR